MSILKPSALKSWILFNLIPFSFCWIKSRKKTHVALETGPNESVNVIKVRGSTDTACVMIDVW